MSQLASREISIINGSVTLKDSQFSTLDAQLLQENSCRIQNLEIRESELTNIEQTGIFSLSNLQTLDLRNNKLDYISDQISLLKNLSVLRLDHNNITSIPIEIFDLPLVVLTLSFNSLFLVPKTIQNLKNLTFLSLAENHIQELPSDLGKLRSLKTLHLHRNEFWRIPCKLGHIEPLQEMTLEWMHYVSPVGTKYLKGSEKKGKIWELKGLLVYKDSQGYDFLALKEFLHIFSDNDFDLNKTDLRNRNLVHLAAINGDLGVLSGLIQAGCDLNLQDIDECSPLVSALRENNIQASKMLIQAGANPNAGAGLFGCPLNLAVIKSEPWIVKEILKSKHFSFTADSNGNTCLHHLMSFFKKHKHKNSLIADMLVNSGLLVNQVNNDNWTALHIAARKGQTSAIRWAGQKNSQLKKSGKQGFDFNCLGGKNGWSPLHLAAQSGSFKTVVALIEAGALAYVKNSEGKTPKNIAKGDIVLFKYLKRMELEHIKVIVANEQLLDGDEKMPGGIELEYKRLYSHFSNGNLHGIENSVKYSQFASVKADAFYLWNQLKEKNNLRIFMKISEKDGLLVRKEMINAFQVVPKSQARLSLRDGRIGPRLSRSNPPRQSLPSMLLKEDETHSESKMHKKPRFSKSSKRSRLTNDTKTPSLGESEINHTKLSPRNLSSKAMTKETDPYCELSISYTSEFPEGHASEVLLTNARNSLIDLRCEAQMYLDSSKRAANKRSKESLLSQPDSISRSVIVNDQLSHLIQSMHESMRDLKVQLDSVDRKYERSESVARDLRESVIELNEKVAELKIEKSCECSNRCFIM